LRSCVVWTFVEVVSPISELGPVPGTRPETAAPQRDAAVAELFAAHHRRLVGLAALLVDDRGTAEDVVQDAFAGLYRGWRRLRDPNAAVAYLNRAVVNGARDSLRRRRRSGTALLRMVPQPEELGSAEREAVTHADEDRLWRAVTALPDRQRQVLVLRYYLDRSEAEIAQTLAISRGSVKKHTSRALASLATHREDWS
jgi:RNA polymerase sigma-70 factor (sigma-E family)